MPAVSRIRLKKIEGLYPQPWNINPKPRPQVPAYDESKMPLAEVEVEQVEEGEEAPDPPAPGVAVSFAPDGRTW